MAKRILFGLGLLSLIPYAVAWWLGDLRQHTIGFLVTYFVAFALYAGVTLLALRIKDFSSRDLAAAFVFALLMQGFLIFTRPTLSDDMYRYVWDGRVQAQGISPYRYSPKAPELTYLRDKDVWNFINRRAEVTVYPPGAEMVYAVLWRIWPDSVRWFQIVMGLGGLVAAGLLVGLLRASDLPQARVLIYLWSPLLAFETAHSAHVDGLIVPLVVGSWWARLRERDGLVGVLLGLATVLKLYPALLVPALWRPRHPQGRWRLPAAFLVTVAACYAPYVIVSGPMVLGFLPQYFRERFNAGVVSLLIPILVNLGVDSRQAISLLTAGALVVVSFILIARPTLDGQGAIRRSIWPIGVFTLFTQNLFSWYMLWLLPLLVLFVKPGRLLGLRADAWTGWWLFCGLVALSYTHFIHWEQVPIAIWAQYVPLYVFLLIDLIRSLREPGSGLEAHRSYA
jgi:hypothetical protein